ncbi:M20 family peptidase [Serpentinicella sp. ANB-PHB4]|uniref:M20 family peptidase n=1 Tax=Serpentinicella sp. ANB-PHB4 TaxID=3074076 RepID=UPI00285C64C7|nr:M20 family peptidase [Serpentinicella sp. ANB-PHB4]MDR5658844.1 M20 family peptidase [Serpentinicella sp. ANB-PHB4]
MIIIFSIVMILTIIITVNTLRFKSKKHTTSTKFKIDVDATRAAENLSKTIQCKTVSNSDANLTDWDEFKKLQDVIETSYPLVHKHLEKETINTYSLLYKWKGKGTSKNPILLLAHMDVVPVEEGTEKDWTYEAFSGMIKDGFVWGRGALDIKIQMIGALEAIETLLKQGHTPERDIYLAFGHDEEIGGKDGAKMIAQTLYDRGITFDLVLDEGGCVTEGAMKGIDAPVAVVGTCEKGYANIRLTAESPGGHASMPPKNTALGMISKAIVNLEKHQMKTRLTPPVEDMLKYIGPEMKGINKVILANMWLFKPLFIKIFSSNPTGNAMLRTTTAATMAQGGPEPNVMPLKATATFNFRILPGETGEMLLNHIKSVVNNSNIKVEALRLEDPSKASSVSTEAFKHIENTIYDVFPEAVVSPYLVMAGTDARKYEIVSENIYRFSPYRITKDELSKVHATDERISLDNIEKTVTFFIKLISNQ